MPSLIWYSKKFNTAGFASEMGVTFIQMEFANDKFRQGITYNLFSAMEASWYVTIQYEHGKRARCSKHNHLCDDHLGSRKDRLAVFGVWETCVKI